MTEDSVDRMVAAWARSAPELDVSPLELVGRLLLCARHLEQQLVDALRPLDLSFGDFDVLNTVRRRADPDGVNPSELAASSLITTGAMTARLHRLDRSGLITRTADADDGRAVRIRLTAKGRKLAERALAVVLEVDRSFIEPLEPGRQSDLTAALRVLLAAHEH